MNAALLKSKLTMAETEKTFDVLAVNAFNSDRRRMSLLVREVKTQNYYCMCKGAGNIMLALCVFDSKDSKGSKGTLKKNVEKSLLNLAQLGLRTLCIAQKQVDKREALRWLEKWKDAASSMTNRAEKLDAAAAELEVDMTFLGVTAIEVRPVLEEAGARDLSRSHCCVLS